ncbi:hypothetical protein CSQ89_20440 [Chitinimonas sp. BJB300]|nr:hypothetical protein CSQ89_20440 [Chitinimonas sp. BJB300]
MVSGVAAASYPLTGKISIRDSAGKVKTQDLEVGGNFSFDVSEMQSPFMLRASGEAMDEHYVLHAAATNSDGDGHYNVNPITDLIVAKAVGQVAAGYFNGGNYSNLTYESLAKQETAVQARIQPLLSAAGVPENVDLRRHVVAKDESGIKAVLHVLAINVDQGRNEADLINRLNAQKLVEPLSLTAGSGSFNVDAQVAEILREMPSIAELIRQTVELDEKTQLAQVLAILHPDYLDNGETKEEFAKTIEAETYIKESKKLRYFQIKSYQHEALAVAITNEYVKSNKKGREIFHAPYFLYKRDHGGKWLAFGNRQTTNVISVRQRNVDLKDSYCLVNCDAIQLSLNAAFSNGEISDRIVKVIVYGPGLPTSGLVANQLRSESFKVLYWEFDIPNMVTNLNYTYLESKSSVYFYKNNPEVRAIGKWPVYKVELFDAEGKLLNNENETFSYFEAD